MNPDPPSAGAEESSAATLDEAVALHKAGQVREALALYDRVLETRPNDPRALNLSGVASVQLGQLGRGVAFFEAALEAKPDYAEAHNNLGNARKEAGELEAAAAAYGRALELRPDYGEAHYNLGAVHERLGRLSKAAEAYRRAIALMPDDADSPHNLGNVLTDLGELEAAEAAYRRALEIDPERAESYRHLIDLKTYAAPDGDLRAMEALLTAPALDQAQVMELCFALGKVYDDLGEVEHAFAAFERGNRIRRATLEYDIAEREARAERVIGVFDRELLARARGRGARSEAPIFIVGMPRSGTTLVEHILASHSAVWGGGERRELSRVERELGRLSSSGRDYPEVALDLGADDLARLGEGYLEALKQHASGAPRVTDKTTANFWRLGLIHLMLPEARIVHCRREAADTCLSCYMKLFTEGQNFTYELTELGRYYRLYERLMEHWQTLLPEQIMELRYEDLVADQEAETGRLLDFLGLAWEDACLAFHRTRRVVRTASGVQVRQPIHDRAVGRWRRYRHHLGPLFEALGPAA